MKKIFIFLFIYSNHLFYGQGVTNLFFNKKIEDAFITEWTVPSGSFTFPAGNSGVYNAVIDWGDGSSVSIITAYDDLDLTHVYVAGTYNITVTGNFPWFYVNDGAVKTYLNKLIQWGVVISKTESMFYGCSNATSTLPEIPNYITNIETNAFRNSGFTGNLILHNEITDIGVAAFWGCDGFTGNLSIPNSVTTIGDAAFRDCDFNGTLSLGTGLTTMGVSVFFNCNGFIGNIALPSSLTSLGIYCFHNCSGFDGTLTIPTGITNIGENTFNACSGLTQVDCYPLTAPSVGTNGLNLGGTPRELHIQSSGTSGYDVAPWTTTSIFSSIEEDL